MMLKKLPWWIYQMLSSILKKGGWPLVAALVALIAKGAFHSFADLKKYVDEYDSKKNNETKGA